MAKEKIQIRNPSSKRWKKIWALFDENSINEHINPEFLMKLGVVPRQPKETVTLHVKILGEEYSWPFHVSDLNWEELGADAIFGQEFMKLQGLIIKPTSKGMKVEYAPGYPQGPVI
jgi:hypothetical protein